MKDLSFMIPQLRYSGVDSLVLDLDLSLNLTHSCLADVGDSDPQQGRDCVRPSAT